MDQEKSKASSKATAGRELDARIATLMGYRAFKETRGEYTLSIWRKPGEREPWEDFRNPVVERSRFAEVTCEGALKIGFFGHGFPRFSTDIAAAWEVVEKLAEKEGYIGGVEMLAGGFWKARFYELAEDDNVEWRGFASALTAPLAICLAALQTK